MADTSNGFGKDLLFVADVLEAWLANAPEGALRVGSAAADRKIAALHAANDSGFLGGSVEPPPPGVLAAGIAEEVAGEDGSKRYELTDWGRRGIGVILAAARAESRHVPGAPRLTPSQLSGLLRMTLPLVELPDDVEGVVQFGIDPDPDDATSSAAGLWLRIEGGRIVDAGEGPPPELQV